MKKILFLCLMFLSLIFLTNGSVLALEKSNKIPFKGHETFDDVSPDRFSTFAAKNTRISNGVMWTHGKSGAYRVSEKLATQKLNLKDNDWHELKLVFMKEKLSLALDNTR